MTSPNFERSIAFVLKMEGGYVNDENDPGGETRFGISKKSYPDLDIRNLTEQDAKDLYWRDYWDGFADKLNWPLCLCALDAAVQHGKVRAQGFLTNAGGDWKKFMFLREDFYLRLKRVIFSDGWANRMDALWQTIETDEHPLSEEM